MLSVYRSYSENPMEHLHQTELPRANEYGDSDHSVSLWYNIFMNILYCHPKCSTCQKARSWLMDHQIAFIEQDIRYPNPNESELRGFAARSDLSVRKLFNTSGLQYRALKLSERLPDMSCEEQFALLASDGMLVRRPILDMGHQGVLVGFREVEWEQAFTK